MVDRGFPVGGATNSRHNCVLKNKTLADLPWQVPNARPPKGLDSFVLTYKIFHTPLRGPHPPTGNPGSATEKYVKMKELGPLVGTHAGGTSLDPPMVTCQMVTTKGEFLCTLYM